MSSERSQSRSQNFTPYYFYEAILVSHSSIAMSGNIPISIPTVANGAKLGEANASNSSDEALIDRLPRSNL